MSVFIQDRRADLFPRARKPAVLHSSCGRRKHCGWNVEDPFVFLPWFHNKSLFFLSRWDVNSELWSGYAYSSVLTRLSSLVQNNSRTLTETLIARKYLFPRFVLLLSWLFCRKLHSCQRLITILVKNFLGKCCPWKKSVVFGSKQNRDDGIGGEQGWM